MRDVVLFSDDRGNDVLALSDEALRAIKDEDRTIRYELGHGNYLVIANMRTAERWMAENPVQMDGDQGDE